MGGGITSRSDEPIIAVPQSSGANPVAVYLASLQTNRSRITMRDSTAKRSLQNIPTEKVGGNH